MKFDFEKIKKGFKTTASKAKKVSSNAIETAKCKYKVADLKSDINDKYIEIGKYICKNHDDYQNDEFLSDLVKEIDRLKESVNDLNDTIDNMLNKKTCPKCSMRLDSDFDFCPKCGYKF